MGGGFRLKTQGLCGHGAQHAAPLPRRRPVPCEHMLFVAEGDHGIDLGGAACWEEAGQCGGGEQS